MLPRSWFGFLSDDIRQGRAIGPGLQAKWLLSDVRRERLLSIDFAPGATDRVHADRAAVGLRLAGRSAASHNACDFMPIPGCLPPRLRSPSGLVTRAAIRRVGCWIGKLSFEGVDRACVRFRWQLWKQRLRRPRWCSVPEADI